MTQDEIDVLTQMYAETQQELLETQRQLADAVNDVDRERAINDGLRDHIIALETSIKDIYAARDAAKVKVK